MFGTTLRNTFVTAALSIVLGFPAPIVLAMIINQIRQKKWKKIVQTTVYIPYFISTVVMLWYADTVSESDFRYLLISSLPSLAGESVNFSAGSCQFLNGFYVLSAVWQEMAGGSIILFLQLCQV